MKKILGAVIAVVMGATLVGALAACNTDEGNGGGNGGGGGGGVVVGKSDAEIAKQAVNSIRAIYNSKPKETPANYDVMGQTVVDRVNYDVNWTVALAESCTIENFSNYVSVSPMAEDKSVTINITKAVGERIDYTLTASVTVGEATESVSFDRYVPEGKDIGENFDETSISFVGTTTRTVFTSTQQVWTANGITLTNDKGASGTNVDNASSAYHVRIYKSSSVKIDCSGMTELVFYSEAAYTDNQGKTSDYPAWLLQSLQAASWASSATIEAGTAEVNGKTVDTVTVKLAKPVDSLEFTASAGQIRLTQLDVIYNKNGASDQDKLDAAKASLTVREQWTEGSVVTLPTDVGGATVTWAIKEGTGATLSGNTLTCAAITSGNEAQVTLTATLKLGEATGTKDITIKITKIAEAETGTFKMFVIQGNLNNKKLYFNGTINSDNRGETTTELSNAADVTVEKVATGYVLKVNGKYLELNSSHRLAYLTEPTGAWEYNETHKVFTWYVTSESKTYYLGTYNEWETISASEVSYLTSGSNFKCEFAVETDDRSDAEKVAAAKENVALNEEYNTGAVINLPATQNGASLSWTTTSDAVTLEGNTLTVKSTAANGTSVTLNVAISSGDVHDSTTVTFTIKAVNYGTLDAPLSVTEALALVSTADEWTAQVVYMKGIAASTAAISSNGQYYQTFSIKDENNSNTISVYSINLRSGVAAPVQNDEVIVCGYVTYYKGTIKQFSRKTDVTPAVEVYLESNTRGTSTITLTENADVAATSLPANAVNGTTVTFTVTPIDGKEVSAVKVNSKEIEATDGNYSFTVTGNTTVVIETKNAGDPDKEYTYTKVTADNASDLIKDGAVIIISATTGSGSSAKNFAMGSQNGNYRNKVDNFDANNVADAVVTVTLKAVEGKENTYYLITNEAGSGYLTANSSNNVLTNDGAASGNLSEWTITVTSSGTTITNYNGRNLQYNASSPRFAAYTSSQTAPTIYVQVEVTE